MRGREIKYSGLLALDGVSVTLDQEVDASDLDGLPYTPPANASGNGLVVIGFQIVDDGCSAYGSVDMDDSENLLTFDVSAVVDVFRSTNKKNTMRMPVQGVIAESERALHDRFHLTLCVNYIHN